MGKGDYFKFILKKEEEDYTSQSFNSASYNSARRMTRILRKYGFKTIFSVQLFPRQFPFFEKPPPQRSRTFSLVKIISSSRRRSQIVVENIKVSREGDKLDKRSLPSPLNFAHRKTPYQ